MREIGKERWKGGEREGKRGEIDGKERRESGGKKEGK